MRRNSFLPTAQEKFNLIVAKQQEWRNAVSNRQLTDAQIRGEEHVGFDWWVFPSSSLNNPQYSCDAKTAEGKAIYEALARNPNYAANYVDSIYRYLKACEVSDEELYNGYPIRLYKLVESLLGMTANNTRLLQAPDWTQDKQDDLLMCVERFSWLSQQKDVSKTSLQERQKSHCQFCVNQLSNVCNAVRVARHRKIHALEENFDPLIDGVTAPNAAANGRNDIVMQFMQSNPLPNLINPSSAMFRNTFLGLVAAKGYVDQKHDGGSCVASYMDVIETAARVYGDKFRNFLSYDYAIVSSSETSIANRRSRLNLLDIACLRKDEKLIGFLMSKGAKMDDTSRGYINKGWEESLRLLYASPLILFGQKFNGEDAVPQEPREFGLAQERLRQIYCTTRVERPGGTIAAPPYLASSSASLALSAVEVPQSFYNNIGGEKTSDGRLTLQHVSNSKFDISVGKDSGVVEIVDSIHCVNERKLKGRGFLAIENAAQKVGLDLSNKSHQLFFDLTFRLATKWGGMSRIDLSKDVQKGSEFAQILQRYGFVGDEVGAESRVLEYKKLMDRISKEVQLSSEAQDLWTVKEKRVGARSKRLLPMIEEYWRENRIDIGAVCKECEVPPVEVSSPSVVEKGRRVR